MTSPMNGILDTLDTLRSQITALNGEHEERDAHYADWVARLQAEKRDLLADRLRSRAHLEAARGALEVMGACLSPEDSRLALVITGNRPLQETPGMVARVAAIKEAFALRDSVLEGGTTPDIRRHVDALVAFVEWLGDGWKEPLVWRGDAAIREHSKENGPFESTLAWCIWKGAWETDQFARYVAPAREAVAALKESFPDD